MTIELESKKFIDAVASATKVIKKPNFNPAYDMISLYTMNGNLYIMAVGDRTMIMNNVGRMEEDIRIMMSSDKLSSISKNITTETVKIAVKIEDDTAKITFKLKPSQITVSGIVINDTNWYPEADTYLSFDIPAISDFDNADKDVVLFDDDNTLSNIIGACKHAVSTNMYDGVLNYMYFNFHNNRLDVSATNKTFLSFAVEYNVSFTNDFDILLPKALIDILYNINSRCLMQKIGNIVCCNFGQTVVISTTDNESDFINIVIVTNKPTVAQIDLSIDGLLDIIKQFKSIWDGMSSIDINCASNNINLKYEDKTNNAEADLPISTDNKQLNATFAINGENLYILLSILNKYSEDVVLILKQNENNKKHYVLDFYIENKNIEMYISSTV